MTMGHDVCGAAITRTRRLLKSNILGNGLETIDKHQTTLPVRTPKTRSDNDIIPASAQVEPRLNGSHDFVHYASF